MNAERRTVTTSALRILALALVSACLLLASCATEESVWQAVQREDTIDAYQKFLLEYPDHPETGTAKRRIQHKRLYAAETLSDMEQVLRDFPDADLLLSLARTRFSHKLNSDIEGGRWNTWIPTLEEFLANNPGAKLKPEAEQALHELKDFRTASQANTLEAFQAFAREHPKSLLIDEARRSLKLSTDKWAKLPKWVSSNITSAGNIRITYQTDGNRLSPSSDSEPGLLMLRPISLAGLVEGTTPGKLTASVQFVIRLYYSSDLTGDPVRWDCAPLTHLLEPAVLTVTEGANDAVYRYNTISFPSAGDKYLLRLLRQTPEANDQAKLAENRGGGLIDVLLSDDQEQFKFVSK